MSTAGRGRGDRLRSQVPPAVGGRARSALNFARALRFPRSAGSLGSALRRSPKEEPSGLTHGRIFPPLTRFAFQIMCSYFLHSDKGIDKPRID